MLRQREKRRNVALDARLRGDDGWHDVIIRNLSSRGLMIECARAPGRGAFVELRRGTHCIVGHVRWSRGTRFGIRSQERIDVSALLDKPDTRRGTDERAAARIEAAPRPTPAERGETSRRIARYLEWSVIAAIGVVAAGLLATGASTVLKRPLERIETVLSQKRR